MAWMLGTAPFGHAPAGRWSKEIDPDGLFYLERSPKWVRARIAGEAIADSKRARMLHQHLRLPVFLFPQDDVRMDVFRDSGDTVDDPVKGKQRFLTLEHDGRSEGGAASTFDHPLLEGLVELRWDVFDDWLEEERPILGHPRDPYSRIDVCPSSRHVRVLIGDEEVASSSRTHALFESGLPTRWYFPREDVRLDFLTETDTRTTCAYKGHASYWSYGEEDDIAWTYLEPLHDALDVTGMVAFFNERVRIEVDGEPEERIRTQWSRD